MEPTCFIPPPSDKRGKRGGEWGGGKKGAGGAIDKGGRESFHNPEVNEGGK